MNCKSGDLAYISIPFGENSESPFNRRYVTVGVQGMPDFNQVFPADGCWLCELCNPLTLSDGFVFKAGVKLVIRDEFLRPITGLPIEEDTKKEQTA